jgi:hypothetical protein
VGRLVSPYILEATSLPAKRITSDPILDPMSPQLACNDDGTSGALQLTATVQAGSPITAYWNQVWPHPYGPMVRVSFREPTYFIDTCAVDLPRPMSGNDLYRG